MELDQVVRSLSNYRNGTFISIQYMSEVPTTKEHKEHSIIKVVDTVVRLGCSYKNVDRNWVPSETKKSWHRNIYKNIIAQHNNNYKRYIKIFPINNPKCTRVTYWLDGMRVELQDIKDMIKSSNATTPKMYLKDLDTIVKIGK